MNTIPEQLRFLWTRLSARVGAPREARRPEPGAPPPPLITPEPTPVSVQLSRQRNVPLIALLVVVCVIWILRRGAALDALARGKDQPFAILLAAVCAFFVCQFALAWMEKPRLALTSAERTALGALSVCINIPCFNEDPELLSHCIASVFAQTRLPQRVDVVDDGSSVKYDNVRAYWANRVPCGVEFLWHRTANMGKRHAQLVTFAEAPQAIFVTVDSDTVLDCSALDEGLKPFLDTRIASVAGLVLGLNKRRNFLTRLEDIVFTSSQLTMRSAHSRLSSVFVNSGAFALYRSDVVRSSSDAYLNETIFGRPVQFSDDSLLTLYAATKWRTVQQSTAIAFTSWPETWSHHIRQQVRWMRGTSLRTFWRARYLPLQRPAFWLNTLAVAQFHAVTAALIIVAFDPRLIAGNGLAVLTTLAAISYLTTARSLLVSRSDETFTQKLATYAISPLAMIWTTFVSRTIRLYGMVSFAQPGWGTRTQIEARSADPKNHRGGNRRQASP